MARFYVFKLFFIFATFLIYKTLGENGIHVL